MHAGIPPPCQEQTPLGADIPLEQTPQRRHPLGADTPQEQTPPSRQLLPRTVSILLECILVILWLSVRKMFTELLQHEKKISWTTINRPVSIL